MVALGDFNTKSSNWYKHDEAIYKGSKIDVITDLLFNRPIENILSNDIFYEIIICDDRDPPGISNRGKELINEKTILFDVSFIVLRIPCYSIKLNICNMN